MAQMTMVENSDFSISWECSDCLETFKDSKHFDSRTEKCPGCGAKIEEFIELYEDEE